MAALISRIDETCSGIDYEILAEEDKDRIGCPKMLKQLVDKSKGDQVCFIADDTWPEDGWLQSAIEAMNGLPDGWGVVGLNSQPSRHAAHWLADKRMLPLLGGEFFSTDYKHCWCDNELTDIAIDHGRFVFCDEAKLTHNHPVFGTAPVDADYNRVYSDDYKRHDFLTYCRRKRNRYGGGGKLGIGFPIVDNKAYFSFMASVLLLEKPNFTLLLPNFPVGVFPQDIAAVRNNLVEQALVEGCEYLLMMDTDQVYRTQDMIPRMLAHKKPVVSAPVHRRYPPFDPILMRGDIGKWEYVPVEEAYSGDLIQVDATGTGCIMYHISVFEKIRAPWFELGVKRNGSPIGEDILFCLKMKENEIPLFVDTSIEIGHLTSFEVNRQTHMLFRKIHKQ
jgi:GT2 family glycosyltransferase